MNTNDFLVFDFETGSTDIETLEPLEIAAVVINSKTLTLYPDKFESLIRPISMANVEDKALQINSLTRSDLAKAPEQKQVWQAFVAFCAKYKRGNIWRAPIACGHNITNFDLKIINRLCRTYGPIDKFTGKNGLFHPRDIIDTMTVCFLWFENENEPKKYSMDSLREFFGMKEPEQSRRGAHSALVDVEQCAELVIRFLKLHRRLVPTINFKGAFGNV